MSAPWNASGTGGIRRTNLAQEVQNLLLSDPSYQGKLALSPGVKAQGLLRVAANVVNGETVTIGSNVFEVDIINTDAAVDTVGAIDDETNPVLVTTDGAHGKEAGDLIRLENEILKVISAPSTTTMVCARARCGTAIASHADNTDVYESDAAPASNIPVGLVTTLTPAAFTDALVAEINNALAGAYRLTAKASTIFDPGANADDEDREGKVVAVGPTDNEVLIVSALPEALALATTETLAGANNAWSAATMTGGRAAGIRSVQTVARVPTAVEVAVGKMYFDFPFTPTTVDVKVITTATGVAVAWGGSVAIAAGRVTLTNGTDPDWAATDTVYVTAFE